MAKRPTSTRIRVGDRVALTGRVTFITGPDDARIYVVVIDSAMISAPVQIGADGVTKLAE